MDHEEGKLKELRPQHPVDKNMQWFCLIVISLGFLASIGVGIAIIFLTRNPLPLIIPSSLVLIIAAD